MIYIRFASHRARQHGLRELDREPQGYWSMRRESYPGGIYGVTEAEYQKLRASVSHHVRFTKIRGPYDDLRKCWS